jgi:ribulose-phosphate 3-epimerase
VAAGLLRQFTPMSKPAPTYRIAPCILSADFARLGDEVTQRHRRRRQTGSHFDVMDNHYVPNLTFGPMVCQALQPHATTAAGVAVPVDVHLMVQPVDALAAGVLPRPGPTCVSFHPDASARTCDRTHAGPSRPKG